jgi:hypothetical protein
MAEMVNQILNERGPGIKTLKKKRRLQYCEILWPVGGVFKAETKHCTL